jgi:hypothetical protein
VVISQGLISQRLTFEEYRAVLRRDLVSFAQCRFRELNPRTRFAMSWHIEIIAAKRTALRGGKIRRLICQPAAPPEVAAGLGRLSGLVSGA